MQKRLVGLLMYAMAFTTSSWAQHGQTISFGESDYNTILEAAKTQNKNILFYFTHPYCAPCKIMERTVFNQPDIVKLVEESSIPVKVDCVDEKPFARAIQKQFEINRFPTLLIIDSTGKILDESNGFMDKEELTVFMQESKLGLSVSLLHQKLLSGTASLREVARYCKKSKFPPSCTQNYNCHTDSVLTIVFNQTPDSLKTEAAWWNLLDNYVRNPLSPAFQYLLANEQTYVQKYGKQYVDQVIYHTLNQYWSGNMSSKEYKMAGEYVRSIANKHPQAKALTIYYTMLDSFIAIQNGKTSWEKQIATADRLVKQWYHVLSIYEVMNWVKDLCKRYPANKMMIQQARNWMDQLVSLDKTDTYLLHELLADVQLIQRKNLSAKESLQKAIQIAISSNEDEDTITELQRKYQSIK
ncbi:MAG: thioredoxin family protein [Chitinophagaceae bacterium]|nr:thioredoxin family protein [Chitinophagaceae bacterium]